MPYIRESLDKMLKLAQSAGVKSIALPTVGTGLGGLSWDLVKALIEDVAFKLFDGGFVCCGKLFSLILSGNKKGFV